jgi:hypothetical protein
MKTFVLQFFLRKPNPHLRRKNFIVPKQKLPTKITVWKKKCHKKKTIPKNKNEKIYFSKTVSFRLTEQNFFVSKKKRSLNCAFLNFSIK